MSRKLKDVHIYITKEDFEAVRGMCLHKGDLTWHLQQAVKKYVEFHKEQKAKQEQEEKVLSQPAQEV